jgi:Dimethlysulfonioproprionate lyase
MTETLQLLHAPLGEPGSGRVRYGAAMALWRDGLISAEVLEVYRIASAHDARDPLPTLRERGMPMPPSPPKNDPVRGLYLAAREYLLSLDHPGAQEVRAGLPADPGPERGMPAQGNAVVDRWLSPALQALAIDRPTLSQAIQAAADHLPWVTYDAYPRAEIGEAFATGHAFASIIGADAPFAARDFDAGLFLMAPHLLYRDHNHAAPELYAPLTGPHGWRFGPGRPLQVKPAHSPIWNPPFRPHLTLVGPRPFLGFFVWTKDVDETAVVLPSDDWARLERMNLA